MSKQRFIKTVILAIAVLVFIFCVVAIPVEWYIYKYTTEVGTVSNDVTIKEYYNEVKWESKTNGGQGSHTTTTSYSYDDLNEDHVKSLYEGMVTLTVLAIIAEFIVLVCMLINTIGRCCPTKIKVCDRQISLCMLMYACFCIYIARRVLSLCFYISDPHRWD